MGNPDLTVPSSVSRQYKAMWDNANDFEFRVSLRLTLGGEHKYRTLSPDTGSRHGTRPATARSRLINESASQASEHGTWHRLANAFTVVRSCCGHSFGRSTHLLQRRIEATELAHAIGSNKQKRQGTSCGRVAALDHIRHCRGVDARLEWDANNDEFGFTAMGAR